MWILSDELQQLSCKEETQLAHYVIYKPSRKLDFTTLYFYAIIIGNIVRNNVN